VQDVRQSILSKHRTMSFNHDPGVILLELRPRARNPKPLEGDVIRGDGDHVRLLTPFQMRPVRPHERNRPVDHERSVMRPTGNDDRVPARRVIDPGLQGRLSNAVAREKTEQNHDGKCPEETHLR